MENNKLMRVNMIWLWCNLEDVIYKVMLIIILELYTTNKIIKKFNLIYKQLTIIRKRCFLYNIIKARMNNE